MHLDMDAFFASVEERERPELTGKPIVVGADPQGGRGRGVVSTANYEARKYRIGSAMPISKAWKLCPAPKCAYLPVDGHLYGIVSRRIMNIVRECVLGTSPLSSPPRGGETPTISFHFEGEVRRGDIPIEQVSIDEAYVDASFCGSYKRAESLARKIKNEIKKRERLTCSIGVGQNKLIAKIASDFQKPDGLTIVRPQQVQIFLGPMPVRKLPGIGPKTEAQLLRQGIKMVEELRRRCESIVGRGLVPRRGGGPAPALQYFEKICAIAHGIDDSPVVEQYEVKSLGHETTFDKDTSDQAFLTRTLMGLCDEVMVDVENESVRFRTITVRVRFSNFETRTSAHSLKKATNSDTTLKQETLRLLFPYFQRKRLFRLIGVRVSNLKIHDS